MGTTLVEEEEEVAPVLIIRGFQGSDQKTKITLNGKSRLKKILENFFFATSKKKYHVCRQFFSCLQTVHNGDRVITREPLKVQKCVVA